MERFRMNGTGCILLLAIAAFATPSALQAGESEESIREKERELEKNAPEGKINFEREVKGKILLDPMRVAQAKQDGVQGADLGAFVSEKGHGFILRARSAEILKSMQEHDGKVVVATGRLEVNGKYFVMAEITTSQGAGPGRRKLGGL